MSTPKRPGPVAYISLGTLITIGFMPLAFRLATAALNVPIGLSGNLVVVGSLAIFLSAAGGLGCYLIVRYFRALRADDRAAREAKEAELRAEIDRQRTEVDRLHQRMEEVENQAWWGEPETEPGEPDTVELGPTVVPFRRPNWPHRRSS